MSHSALGLSHALGHKLGAKYGIPHGITSCLTLAPTVQLKSKIASNEDKNTLAAALFYLHESSTGSTEEDVRRLGALIKEYVLLSNFGVDSSNLLLHRLVIKLGLHSTLAGYNVPKEDLPLIAGQALGRPDDPLEAEVIKLLESIYDSK